MKGFVACVIILGMALAACETGQKKRPPDKTGCIQGNCSGGKGTYVFPNGNKYVGDFKWGRPEGYGTMYYRNGTVLEGRWKGGRPDIK